MRFISLCASRRMAPRSRHSRATRSSPRIFCRSSPPREHPTVADRGRRLEREVRSVELLSSSEKLMAGLPNYATYFGRDGLMSALMMRSIWTPVMSERVIASVLGKLGARRRRFARGGARRAGDPRARRRVQLAHDGLFRQSGMARARARTAISPRRARCCGAAARARELSHDGRRVSAAGAGGTVSRGHRGVGRAQARLPAGHGEQRRIAPRAHAARDGARRDARRARSRRIRRRESRRLRRRDSTHWQSASWRDSDAGYANGRFAMDINAIWAPRALRGHPSSLHSLRALGYTSRALDSVPPALRVPVGRMARRLRVRWIGRSRIGIVRGSCSRSRSDRGRLSGTSTPSSPGSRGRRVDTGKRRWRLRRGWRFAGFPRAVARCAGRADSGGQHRSRHGSVSANSRRDR